MNIKWTVKIINKELWRITKQKPIEIQIKRRKWNWIGHTLCKEAGAIQKKILRGIEKEVGLRVGGEGQWRMK
jgi:hypothetical protein